MAGFVSIVGRPLFGRRVIVTRASHQADELLHMLAAKGADAVAFPCLAIAAPEDANALAREIADLPARDGLILSSPNGVRAFFDALHAAGFGARRLHGKTVAVIGTGTAKHCQARGLRPSLIPAEPRAEGLCAELHARGLLTQSWLHVRADEGRALLQAAIQRAGGDYHLAIGYRTIRPQVPTMLVRSLRAASEGGEGCDVIAFASGKSARHFVETLTEHVGADETRVILARAKVVVLGPVTAAAAEAIGIRVDQIAASTDDASMLAAILKVCSPKPKLSS